MQMEKMSRFALAKRFVLFALVWLALSRAAPGGWAFGVAAAGAATWASMVLLPPGTHRLDLFRLLRMLPGFAVLSLRGGIDVAWRALHPRMPLDPGWIGYRTRLPPGLPRVSFGSETSLLPGSLVAGSRGGLLYVHCLDLGQQVRRNLAQEELRVGSIWRGDGTPDDAP